MSGNGPLEVMQVMQCWSPLQLSGMEANRTGRQTTFWKTSGACGRRRSAKSVPRFCVKRPQLAPHRTNADSPVISARCHPEPPKTTTTASRKPIGVPGLVPGREKTVFVDTGPQTTHIRPVKTDYYKIRADAALAMVVADAMARTGLGQSELLRLGSMRGVPEITVALAAGEHVPRIPEAELRKRISRLRLKARLTPSESNALRKQGRK
jgi:hypothetical protein